MYQNEINALAAKHGLTADEQKIGCDKRMHLCLTREIPGEELYYQAIISYLDGQDADVETTVGLYGKRLIENLGEEACANMASAVAHVSDRINSFETSLRFGSRPESKTVEQLLRDRFTKDRVPVCIREGRDLSKHCAIFFVSPVGIPHFPSGDFKTELGAKEFCESNHLPIEPYEVLGAPNIKHPYYASTLADAVRIVNNSRHLEKTDSVTSIMDAYAHMKAMVAMVSHTWIQGRVSLELLQSAALGIPIDQIAST